MVDGIEGPASRPPWLPARSLATLELGTPTADKATLIVDNWFAFHHLGLQALSWDALSNGSQLIGFSALPGATSGASAGMRAPPLPQCWPTQPDGTFQHPLQATVKSFPDFATTDIVQRGSDAEGYVASMHSAGAQGWPEVQDPAPLVRVLPWHRLFHNESGDFHSGSMRTEEGKLMLYASMTELSRQRYCGVGGTGINPDFAPPVGCDGTPKPEPSTRYPYCERRGALPALRGLLCWPGPER
jgi:hypothetical protein